MANIAAMTDDQLTEEYEAASYNFSLASQFNEATIKAGDYLGELNEERERRGLVVFADSKISKGSGL